MRISILLLFMLSLILNLQAQNYEITFTASGAGATVDEVEVVYLSKADTITVSGTDVLKLVGEATGIPSSFSGVNGLQVYPNPMKAESRIQFYTSTSGVVNLEVFDITGKLVVSSKQELRSGDQTFALSGLHSGLYTLRASIPGQVYSTRVISIDKNAVMPALRHEKSDAVTRTASTLKSGSEEVVPVELEYTDGDWILLKGKSGDHLRVVTIAPNASQAVNFDFVACTDYDGNNYPVVSLGDQTWTTENLIATKFDDGTDIMNIEADALWFIAEIPGYCWVENDEENYGYFGMLYNWAVAGGEKNPCPSGWHVPTYDEWMVLSNYLRLNGYNWFESTDPYEAGKALSHIYSWNASAVAGSPGLDPLLNNKSGMSFLSNGRREAAEHVEGSFRLRGRYSYFWTATESSTNSDNAWHYMTRNDIRRHEQWEISKKRGAAIRCVKDTDL